jgi:hypothetical protein
MATATDTKHSLGLTAENTDAIARVAFLARLTTGLLLALGGLGVVGSVFVLIGGAGFFNALWCFVQGALTALMGLVMLAIAADLEFLGTVPAYSKNHLKNGVEDLRFYFKLQFALALIWAVVLVLKLWM